MIGNFFFCFFRKEGSKRVIAKGVKKQGNVYLLKGRVSKEMRSKKYYLSSDSE